jgi:hypothetical protein
MTYMRSWKSHRLTSHTWLGLNPQIGRPLSKIVVPLVYLCLVGFCVLMINLGFHDAHNYIENITKLYFWTFFQKLLSKINQCTKMLILRTIFLKSS